MTVVKEYEGSAARQNLPDLLTSRCFFTFEEGEILYLSESSAVEE